MERFSTNEMSSDSRVDYWNRLCGQHYSAISIDPLDKQNFNGELIIGYDDIFKVSSFKTDPVYMERTRVHTRSACSTGLTAFLRLEGNACYVLNGENKFMKPNEIMLMDSFTTFEYLAQEPTHTVAICIPDNFVLAHLPNIDKVVGNVIGESEQYYPIIFSLLNQVYSQSIAGNIPSAKILRGALEVISATFEENIKPQTDNKISSNTKKWFDRANLYIQNNIRDNRLNAGAVSEKLGISTRYLRMVFADYGENISNFIQSMRLEESARCLINPSWNNISISSVAEHWGFEDAAYFAKCFKAKFGISPSEFRINSSKKI